MSTSIIEYPAVIYQGLRNHVYIANCFIKNLVAYGHSAAEAIENLEKTLEEMHQDYIVKVKPMNGLVVDRR
ncbi:MAG: hypothetical protein PHV37_01320 [Candidatus Gastranaerophilales bacterium]|nr:hypothetical protein [Candidatus Gastranaerophilales bacterium]